MHADLRDEYISRVVGGHSFADVGGLWGTVNEKASVAHRFGATALTMIDMQPEGNEWWQKFQERMRAHEISGCQCISAQLDQVARNSFDVVHCSGVLYHHPHPLTIIADLRAITRRHLILTSAITQEHISNAEGEYRIPASGVLFVPALSERERRVLSVHWKAAGAEVHGITTPVKFELAEFGPWWWLPTAGAMRAMAETCGFRVVEGDFTWNSNAYTILCEAVN